MKSKSKSKSKSPTPTGLHHPAQGCEPRATLGHPITSPANPERVTAADRNDHETIFIGGRFIPILGTVGGTPEESRQTARNIERFTILSKEAA